MAGQQQTARRISKGPTGVDYVICTSDVSDRPASTPLAGSIPSRSRGLTNENEPKLPDLRWLGRRSSCSARRATRGGALGHLPLHEIFKTLHSNFDICRNFQRTKMNFYILIIFKKSYWNFCLSCSLIIISLQDLSRNRLSYQNFLK